MNGGKEMQKKLYRSTKDSMMAGVCGGLGEYFEVDSTIVRLVVAFMFIGSFGTALVVYFLAAMIIPRNPNNVAYYDNGNGSVKMKQDDSDDDIIITAKEEDEFGVGEASDEENK